MWVPIIIIIITYVIIRITNLQRIQEISMQFALSSRIHRTYMYSPYIARNKS